MFNLSRQAVRPAVTAAALGLLMLVMAACSSVGTLSPFASASTLSDSLASNGAHTSHHVATSYRFTTLDDRTDPTFNQLLGINDLGVIAGYFGSGATGHPNKGYTLRPPDMPLSLLIYFCNETRNKFWRMFNAWMRH
jgi:hypothetical protein